jgi:ribosomal-protein-alanine N-acetyltransferase
MLKVEILKACEAHIDDIMIIENLSFAIPWSRKSITDEVTVNKFALYYCAVIDGRVVGYAGMWHVCDEGHITNIAVHPDFRCNGIGSALMERLLETASDEKITSMTLEVRRSNLTAQMLYRKFGFEDAGYRRAYYADNGEDALIMWKHDIA